MASTPEVLPGATSGEGSNPDVNAASAQKVPWDPWEGLPQPEDEKLKNAFKPFENNPSARAVIDELLELGRKINDLSLGPDRPTRDDFEALADKLAATPEGKFLLEDHAVLGALNLMVIRAVIDGVVGGHPVPYRAGKRS